MDNEDREGFSIRFTCHSEIKVLEEVEEVSRMKCVEPCSSEVKWGSFRLETLFGIVKAKKEAQFPYVIFADDYYEYISSRRYLKKKS